MLYKFVHISMLPKQKFHSRASSTVHLFSFSAVLFGYITGISTITTQPNLFQERGSAINMLVQPALKIHFATYLC